MIANYLLLCLFGLSPCFVVGTLAREAIIGGRIVHDTGLAYQVSVWVHQSHVCGGGILGNRFILTAAHCVLNDTRHLRSGRTSVIAGTTNLNKIHPPALIIRVEQVFVPKDFHPTEEFSRDDIAVLKLAHSLESEYRLGSWHEKLDLPQHNETHNVDDSFVSGFGWSEYDNGVGHTDGLLRVVPYSILSDDECKRAFPDGTIQRDIHLCAVINSENRANDRRGVCTGDSGGPLVQIKTGRIVVIGVLSRIPHCGNGREPAVFTRVAYYEPVIRNIIESDPRLVAVRAWLSQLNP